MWIIHQTLRVQVLHILPTVLWNFRRLSGYELAGNEIFLRHRSSGDWGSGSAVWVEWSAIKGVLITWESILGRHLV